jgi:hypothetical protein
VQADETLAAAARKLQKDHIGCLPVCQDKRVIGMITDRDITMRGVADARNVTQMKVREVMSTGILFCFEDDSIERAAALMSESHVHRLAVLDRQDQHLIGVISVSDLSGGASGPRPYEVIFYKKFNDHYGHPHHTELMRVAVAHGTKEEAIAAAIGQFEQTKQVKAWNNLADGYDVKSVHLDEQGATVEELELTTERESRIQRRAHELWERAGAPTGQDVQFWTQAAGEIDSEDRHRE